MVDICCIGHITKDRIITPRHTVYMAGGTSFYFSYAFNHLPHKVSFKLITKIGAEDMKAVHDMRMAGIEVEVYPSAETVFFENKYGEDQNDRTQRVLAKADPFMLNELSDAEAKIFHLGSLLNDDFSVELIRHLAQKGRISIDAQGFLRHVFNEQVYPVRWKEKEKILACTDILKVNEHEMEAITGLTNPRMAALQLAGLGVKEVLITLGSYGSLVYAEGNFYEIPAYKPTDIIDATGCGDTYAAGYLYCRSQGESYEEAAKFAAAMCTLKLEHSGAFDRTIDDVNQVLQANRV
ncbi:MAG TPA: PfkB family carbohydrate kinase [Prevotella sp.]